VINKELAEYLSGQRNAVRDTFILSREKANGAEYVSVSLPDNPTPIYNLWTKPIKKANPNKATGIIEEVKPKHTGGKRPYIMLMQDQNDITNTLSIEAAGLMFKLLAGGFIEWDTGRIMDRRSKQPLTIDKIRSRYKLGKDKSKTIIKELTENDIIKYDHKQRAYFFNAKFARKGGGSNANKIQEGNDA